MKKIYYPIIVTAAAAILVTASVPATQATAAVSTQITKAYAADTAMYRGIVTQYSFKEDGNLEVTLNQVDGTDFGLPSISFLINTKTKTSFDIKTVEAGMYLEIYYAALTNKSVTNPENAISVFQLNEAEACNYNGVVKKITPDKEKKGTGIILLKDENGQETVFHYSQETQLYLDLSKLKPGDALNIYHKGIMTRSLPPQGVALEIRKQSENVVYRGNVTSVKTAKGVTTLKLTRAKGSPFAKNTVSVTLDSTTKTSLTPSKIKKGTYLELYYNPSPKAPNAISVKELMESSAVNYNGVVVSVTKNKEKEGYGTILMSTLTGDSTDPMNQTYFHYGPNTTFSISLDKLKKGTKLNIYHQGIELQSLPPQCYAKEISAYVK